MAKIDFPVAISDGQEFTASTGVVYTYVGTPPAGYWSAEVSGGGGGGGSQDLQAVTDEGNTTSLGANFGGANIQLKSGGDITASGSITAAGNITNTGATLYSNGSADFNNQTIRINGAGSILAGTTSYSEADAKIALKGSDGSITAAGDVKIGGTLPSAPNITLASDGNADIGGRVVANGKGLITDSGEIISGYNINGDQTFSVFGDGNITAAGDIDQTKNLTQDGVKLASVGNVKVRRDTPSAINVFEAYKGGNAVGDITVSITNDGSATFTGSLLVGTNTAQSNIKFATNPVNAYVQHGNSGNKYAGQSIISYSTADYDPILTLGISNSSTLGSNGLVGTAFDLGKIQFVGNDGTGFQSAAVIDAFVDGVAAAGDMPGTLRFSTSSPGSVVPTERLKIDSQGTATFAGTVSSKSYFTSDRDAAGKSLFSGYFNGVENLNIIADGSIYAGNIAGSGTAGPGNINLQLNANGSAQFAGPVKIGGTADVNEISEYEEGTWTPVIGSDFDNKFNEGKYTKIGNVVNVCAQMIVECINYSATNASVTFNLPFPIDSGNVGGFPLLIRQGGPDLGDPAGVNGNLFLSVKPTTFQTAYPFVNCGQINTANYPAGTDVTIQFNFSYTTNE